MRSLPIVALLGLVVALNACGKSGPDLPPASEFPKPGDPAKLVVKEAGSSGTLLRFTPTAGTTDTVKATIDMDMNVSAAGTSMSGEMDLTSDAVNTVEEVKADKTFTQKSVIQNAKMKFGGDIGAQMGAVDDNTMSDMMNGQSTVITIDEQGRIISLEMPDNPLMKSMGGGMDSALKGNAVAFPDSPVGVGAVWQSLSHIDMMGLKLLFVCEYELVALDGKKGKVKASMRGGIGDGESATIEEMGGAKVKSLSFTGGGTIDFDLERPTASTMDLEMKFAADMEIMGESGSFELKGTMKVEK